MNEKYEQMDLPEAIEKWQDDNNCHNFEGTSGVGRLQKFLGAIGYKEGNYLGYGNEIINFLSDNSGAIETLINWIGEQNVDEWKENLIDVLPELEDEEENRRDEKHGLYPDLIANNL